VFLEEQIKTQQPELQQSAQLEQKHSWVRNGKQYLLQESTGTGKAVTSPNHPQWLHLSLLGVAQILKSA